MGRADSCQPAQPAQCGSSLVAFFSRFRETKTHVMGLEVLAERYGLPEQISSRSDEGLGINEIGQKKLSRRANPLGGRFE